MCVRVAQLEEAWTVNHAVGRSSPSWTKLTKSLQQASNPKKAAESFGSRPKLKGCVYHNNKDPPLPFTHWASAKAAWYCQPGCVAQCIPPDYTDSLPKW